jgi:hypothetical protein
MAAANDIDARRMLAAQRAYERGEVANKPAEGGRPAAIDENLLSAEGDQILSGQVLNDLAAAIRRLESKGAKAESPLLPAGLLAQVEYTGGPSADTLMLLRAGPPEFPEPLRGARFDRVRADLERPIAAVAEPMLAGKRVEVAAAEKLSTAVKKAKADVAPAVREMPLAEATAVTRFFNRLLALADVAKAPGQATGLIVPKWATIGASASELVSHLDRYKLAFGPAEAGAVEAYGNLYQGLAGYYVALAQAKK